MIKYVTKRAICVDCLVYGTNPASNIKCCRILRFYLDIVRGKVRLFELVIKGELLKNKIKPFHRVQTPGNKIICVQVM